MQGRRGVADRRPHRGRHTVVGLGRTGYILRYADGRLAYTVKLDLPSHPRYLSVLRALVEQLAATAGFTEKECRGITLALDEACSNIMRHAYQGRNDASIEFQCTELADRLEFVLRDRGVPLDPARLRHRSLDEIAMGGLGSHLIAMIMDDVQYERQDDRNQLRLVKLRAR